MHIENLIPFLSSILSYLDDYAGILYFTMRLAVSHITDNEYLGAQCRRILTYRSNYSIEFIMSY